MASADPHTIRTTDELRVLIGEPHELTPLKVDFADGIDASLEERRQEL